MIVAFQNRLFASLILLAHKNMSNSLKKFAQKFIANDNYIQQYLLMSFHYGNYKKDNRRLIELPHLSAQNFVQLGHKILA